MSPTPTSADPAARAAPQADARLDALDAAAVGLLEPLIHATDAEMVGHAPEEAAGAQAGAPAAAGGWRVGLADALERLAAAALELELIGLGHAAGLLRAHLLGSARPEDAALELASAEGWVSDAIAFCSGHLPAAEAGTLIERLLDWPGMAGRAGTELVGPISARLRQDAERIAAATLAAMEPAPLEVGADELEMLAEAAGQLDEEFAAVLAGDETGARFAAHDAELVDALEAGVDAVERFANAVGYIGLAPVAAALETLHDNLKVLARDPQRFAARHRELLAQLGPAWARLFGTPSPQAAAEALALLGDAARPRPAPPEALAAARRRFDSLATIGTRRVAAAREAIDESELSLEIPVDADRGVVENLLRELPALSAELSACIDRVAAGSGEAIAAAQRIAHTLKGSANTVGVRGIALLTHQLEDLLQLLGPGDEALSTDLAGVLAEAADCVAEMSESVAGLGPPPRQSAEVLRSVRGWTNRLLQHPDAWRAAAEPVAAAAPVEPVATPVAGPTEPVAETVEPVTEMARPVTESPDAVGEPAEPVTAPTGPAADEWLRVPASLIERLLACANEASILLSQAQEQALEVDRMRATLRLGTDQLQDLAGELERLVGVRGTALGERRTRENFDALELDEYDDLHMVSRRIAESGADGRLIEQTLGGGVAALRDSLSQLERVQVELREAALQTRTVRVETVVPRWRRTVRQAARATGHEASLQVEGESTEIDTQLLQALVDPVAHLLRNAIDHGIEAPAQRRALGKPPAGRIVLACAREGADPVIDCSDDGRGLDLRAVRDRAIALGLLDADARCDDAALARFVLAPGFSTRAHATQLSGRGIGLDVVNRAVREQRGTVDISSVPGEGMRVRLRVPVRMAAMPVIIVRSRSHVLALAVREVEQVLPAERIVEEADGTRRFHGAAGPMRLVRLEDALGLPEDAFAPPPGAQPAAPAVLQVRLPAGERVAVLVAEPGQTRNVVVRPLASFLPPIPGIEGAAVLGDGAVAPVADLSLLLTARAGARAAPALEAARRVLPVCLVVDDSVSVRRTMEHFVRDLGYQADGASDGIEALERVARRVPALVLADLEMPRMNGVELVRALRENPATRAVPVIMITSRSSAKHRQLALDAGVDVFLTKPYTEDVLAGHIARLVDRR
ncbi:MAG: response regulator [Burkholderiaceae bacterium]|nr:response regulator [Burkholderiaceae bacterium]